MALNTAQYIAPLNSQQVLNGYVQGVKQGAGITIQPDGTITLDPVTAAGIGFIISNNNAAAQYIWPTATGSARQILVTNGGNPGSLSWTGSYVEVYPLTSTLPHLGAAALPAGDTGNRPAGAVDGWLRYNTDFDFFEFYSTLQNTWLPMSQSTGAVFSFVQAPPGPTANAVGDIWYNTLNDLEYVWDGLAWQPSSPLGSTANPGRLQVGANLNVTGGVVTVPAIAAPAGGVSATPGVVYLNDTVTSNALDQALTANQGMLLQQQIAALLIANNLTFAGTIDGVTGTMIYVTPAGFLKGFAPGSALPPATVSNEDYFVIVVGAGSFAPPGSPVITVTQGDWFLSTGANWQFLDVGYNPPYATTTTSGVVELATDAETQTGTDTIRVITPSNLSSRTATETRTGIAEIATQIETNNHTDDTRIVTPLKLYGAFASGAINANDILINPQVNGNTNIQAALNDAVYNLSSPGTTISFTENPFGQYFLDVVQATENQLGGAQIATQVETNTGTDDSTIVTPFKLSQYVATGQIVATEIPLNPSFNGYINVQQAASNALYDIESPNTTLDILETATGFIDIDVVQANEIQLGGAEMATQAETEAGTDDTKMVSPLKLRTAAVYKSDFNAKGDILSASADDLPLILPVGTPGQYLKANPTTATGLQWGTIGFTQFDDISAGFNGTAVSFPLQIAGVGTAPAPSTNIMVYLGGVPQIPGVGNSYTIAGNIITFATAPDTGTTFYAVTVM